MMSRNRKIIFSPIFIIVPVYLVFSFVISIFLNFNLYYSVINPLFWVLIATYCFKTTNNRHGRFEKLGENIKLMLIIVLFHIILNALLGFLFGFAKNPYSRKPLIFLLNVWQIIIPILSIEYTRSAIANQNSKNRPFLIILSIILFLASINFKASISQLGDLKSGFEYISSALLPSLCSSFLYTFLALKGSYKLVLTFTGILSFYNLFVPVLANIDWFMTGIIGVVSPLVIYLVYKESNVRRIRESVRARQGNPLFYIPFFSIVALFSLFMANVFPCKPISILSNSMIPTFERGDVVVYDSMNEDSLKKLKPDAIIVYSKDKQVVVHRIIDKFTEDDEVYYITKGDANNSRDAKPVAVSQILGVYQFSIKFVGYPSVWLNQIFNHEKPTVETK